MLSKGEAKRQQAELARQRRAMEKRMAREHLAHLRAQVKEARSARRSRIAGVRSQCRQDRERARQRVKELRRVAALELKARIADEHAGQVQACQIRREQARQEARGHVDQAAKELEAERAYRRDMRRITAANRKKTRDAIKASAKEKRSESDGEVAGNIPPELAALWQRVKGSIRANDRMSRTEAFLHYAEEHPEEVLLAVEDRTEAVLRDLERQEREHRRAMKKTRPRRAAARASGSDEVPF